jgi:hypothetical protein
LRICSPTRSISFTARTIRREAVAASIEDSLGDAISDRSALHSTAVWVLISVKIRHAKK